MHRGFLDDVFGVVQRTTTPAAPLSSARSLLMSSVEAVGFWTSVALPLAYIPLFLTGIVSGAVAGQLLVLHLIAVVLGHSYGR